ncbi:hypothetical protein BDZ97DRAFT_1827156 [Flammula alnicola]|nr:hypothetical protein BDZ97DRAFT_1827156 [Flammula alnicola]
MNFSVVSIVLSVALFSQSSAAQYVYHCGGPNSLICPCGYRCCGPIIVGVGGTCFLGETGICPL